jgi:hypothetical protein
VLDTLKEVYYLDIFILSPFNDLIDTLNEVVVH